jgi:hypothetical protein
MSKLDDIRKMREANYERQNSKVSSVRSPARPAGAGTVPPGRDGGAGKSVEVLTQVHDGGGSQNRGFDRTAYQREYMRKWRKDRTAELKRLRELMEKSK